VLVQGFGRPKYSEFDPTLLVFLTFPLMFGFMIGDVGYGVLYAAIGFFLYSRYDGTFRELGAVALWAGGFTILFGICFGIDVFGYHAYQLLPGEVHWPVDGKGLSPADIDWALSFLVASVLFGLAHLNVGHILSFVSNYQQHDLKHAMYEGGSWLLILNGAWIWIFSQHVPGPKPDFLFEAFSILTFGAVSFTGFPVAVGYAAIVAIVLGVVLLAIGEPPELAEVLAPIVNVISYARIMAVLLAKGGMALAVNLLAFGAYIDEGGEGSFHFIFSADYLEYVQNHPGDYELVFAGITTAFDPASIGAVGILARSWAGSSSRSSATSSFSRSGSPPPAFRRCVSSTWSSSGTSTRARRRVPAVRVRPTVHLRRVVVEQHSTICRFFAGRYRRKSRLCLRHGDSVRSFWEAL